MRHEEATTERLEELIREVLSREEVLLEYYHETLGLVGGDARVVLANLRRRHSACLEELRRFQEELALQRELTGSIAD